MRLVLTLKARYDTLGLGLVGAPGPVLVPLLLEQATALVADPYGPAVVYPSRVRRGADGGGPPGSAADVREPTAPTAAQVTRGTQEQAPSGSAAAAASVPVVPADQSADDEGPSALPESASPDAAASPMPGSASPSAVDQSTSSGEASGDPDPSVAPPDPGTDVGEPVCTTEVVVPDAGAPSTTPPTEVVDPTAPGAPTGDGSACATESAPDAGAVTAETDPSVDASVTAAPEPTQEPAPALP